MSRSQVGALVALRWAMVRSRRGRWGFGLLAAAVPVLAGVAAVAGLLAPREKAFEITVLAPTVYLAVAALALLGPLVAGGGNELFPPEQTVAFPLTTRTQYLASLVLTPLNLAWTTQLLGVLGLTAYIVGPTSRLALAMAVCLAYVGAVTIAAQALGWGVIGLRQSIRGRRVTWILAAVTVLLAASVVVTGRVSDVLDRSPTTRVVISVVDRRGGLWSPAVQTLVALLLLAFVADRVAGRLCAWALTRPGRSTDTVDSRQVSRRGAPADEGALLRAVDRASVWRSASLRRGLLVLSLLPGGAAAAAGLDWSALVLMPGLVSAGAGLLFGVNAFCLDGSGTSWLGSLPHWPRVAFASKARVVAETCLAAVLLTLVAGLLRAERAPTAAEMTALVGCAASAVARVTSLCMRLSVTRPHRADLRSPRDTPAPPGAMAVYSARLAFSTTLMAVVFSAMANGAPWPAPLLLAVVLVSSSMLRLGRTARSWGEDQVRAQVVTRVTAG